MDTLKQAKTRVVTEFGDFQTPPDLALSATKVLRQLGIRPRSVLEPTCGRGAFVFAAAITFPGAESIIGVEVNRDHLRSAADEVNQCDGRVKLLQGDFFSFDWPSLVTRAAGPWLIVGNPPWVTSSSLAAIGSNNVPEKSNFQGRNGMDAITGKSNFDISEWMLLRYLDWLNDGVGTIAVLCKSAVARKILLQIWKDRGSLRSARIYKIDALSHFGAAVDACFFVLEIAPDTHSVACDVYDSLDAECPSHTFGFVDGHLIRDVVAFERHRDLLGPEKNYVWRSGVKHDCSKVMELATSPAGYRNGLGETVALEDTFLFPMLKSSDIGNGRIACRGMMIVTQRLVGEDTSRVEIEAPKTWGYLKRHSESLSKRGSVIYRNKPEFSIFGVGPYTFSPWKVAISGFYKRLHFVKVGPVDGKPVVFDDTVYFLPCWSEEEACFIEGLLRSEPAKVFFNSMIHWEEKRPVTVEVLKRLSISRLSEILGCQGDYHRFTDSQHLPLLALP
jgi:hypothetical protein